MLCNKHNSHQYTKPGPFVSERFGEEEPAVGEDSGDGNDDEEEEEEARIIMEGVCRAMWEFVGRCLL